jgi:hypothetical protein
MVGPNVTFENRYGLLDRLLHRIAFRAGTAQQAMADVEEILYRKTLQAVPLEDPVFISGLPRSGTTILLNILWDSGYFASHTYRDMPFVLCPMVWQRLSFRFTVDDAPRERAHADGLQVSGDSPEAFEEMIWKHFWPTHYETDRIRPWTSSDENPEFDDFLEAHMRKIIVLRRHEASDNRRYLSKNNLQIARLAAPPRPLRRGLFLIPFRDPVQHAASMLRQHRRFLQIHAKDDFTRLYMEAIGHHEFGQGLRPVDFGGWMEGAPPPEDLTFWIRYWNAAYSYVLEHAGSSARLVSYARLVGEPKAALARLADVVGVPTSILLPRAERLRPPRTHDVKHENVHARAVDEASAVYENLEARAVV